MAIELGKVNITDLTQNDYKILGIGINKSSDRGGIFSVNYTTLTQAKDNITNLLMTKKGERLGQPNFGTNLGRLLFEQNDGDLEDKIYTTIANSIKKWLPQLSIQSIDIKSTDEMKDRNTMEVSIVFTANYSGENFKVDFAVKP